MPTGTTKLLKYLANLGYGSRRDVARLLADGRARDTSGRVLRDGDHATHDDVRVDGTPLDPAPGVVVMLHKPLGYVCATQGAEQLVYELLPTRFLRRSPVMAPVGRLDRDTTGLLLLTDDGALNHRLTSPRSHVAKTYRVTLASPINPDDAERLASGTLLLSGESEPLRPAQLDILTPHEARVTVTEGRYHHVRRMFAALGNHVVALHRERVGELTLDDLAVGSWRVLPPDDLARLAATTPSSPTRP